MVEKSIVAYVFELASTMDQSTGEYGDFIFLKVQFAIYVLCMLVKKLRLNVAQSGRALALGARGYRFDACHSDHATLAQR